MEINLEIKKTRMVKIKEFIKFFNDQIEARIAGINSSKMSISYSTKNY